MGESQTGGREGSDTKENGKKGPGWARHRATLTGGGPILSRCLSFLINLLSTSSGTYISCTFDVFAPLLSGNCYSATFWVFFIPRCLDAPRDFTKTASLSLAFTVPIGPDSTPRRVTNTMTSLKETCAGVFKPVS